MKGFQCDELFAFVAVDKDGNEGIVMATHQGDSIPLITANLETVKVFVPLASYIAKTQEINIKLYHFKRLGEVSKEFLDQFVDVQLEGDPGGAGEVEDDTDGSEGETIQ